MNKRYLLGYILIVVVPQGVKSPIFQIVKNMSIKFRSVSVLFGEHVPVAIFLQYADFYVVDTQ